jgi:hypothetical protein
MYCREKWKAWPVPVKMMPFRIGHPTQPAGPSPRRDLQSVVLA